MPVRRWQRLTWPAVVLLLLAYVTVTSSGKARADENLTPTADTFVNGRTPDKPLGKRTYMRSDDSREISYVKFPAPAVGGTATLRIWGRGAQDPIPFDVHRIPNTWNESTTYNTRPALGAKVGSGTVVSKGYTSVDVGSVNGVTSFAIVRTRTGPDSSFSTRETGKYPRLVVVASSPDSATSSPDSATAPDSATSPKDSATSPKDSATSPKDSATSPKDSVTSPKDSVTSPKHPVTPPPNPVTPPPNPVTPPNSGTDNAGANPPSPSQFTNGCVGKPWRFADGKFPLDWTWRVAHDAYSGRAAAAFNTFVSSGTATLACVRGHNHQDGWHPREDRFPTNRGTMDIHDAYFTGMRDDCIENDNFMPGRITNVLCDGTFAFHSEQVNGGGTPDTIGPNEGRVIYLDRVYARLHNNSASSEATIGRWFKTESSVENHTLDITDSVFALNEPPRMANTGEIRWSNLNFPPGTVFRGTNYILWLGPVGGYRGPTPAGVTFLEGQAAHDKWNYFRNGWLEAHCLPTRPANDLKSVDDPVVAPSC